MVVIVSVFIGICVCGGGLVLVDVWNYWVLIWKELLEDNNVFVDIVLG